MGDFYDATKLLSMNDLTGKKPEIYLTTGNRSSGKTTWFSRYAVKNFKTKGKKFCLVYRWNYEMSDCADKFFKDIQRLFFPTDTMTEKRRAAVKLKREQQVRRQKRMLAVSAICIVIIAYIYISVTNASLGTTT